MRFNSKARLDTSQVQDTRGSGGGGGGGGGGLGNLGGLAKGGGGLGIVAVLVFVAIQIFGGGGNDGGTGGVAGGLLSQLAGGSSGAGTADNSKLDEACKVEDAANKNSDCALVAVINSVQGFWADALSGSGTNYAETDTVFFTGSVNTGCGGATSDTGPFYCPADKLVYVDLSFFDDLRTKFGANSATFTQAYVLAHEYGHHVQNLLGTSSQVGSDTGPTSGSVRLELQADCYAGAWANHAKTVPDADGTPLIAEINQQDIEDALQTAESIGDDYIQTKLGGGSVDESQFSHGTSAQRSLWFQTGFNTGDPAACDTFAKNVDLG